MDFTYINEHWLSILSLGVAFLGGVPGIVASIDYFYSFGRLKMSCRAQVLNVMRLPSGEEYTGLLLVFVMTNNRERPVFPDYFRFYLRRRFKWFQFQPQEIPKDADFSGDNIDFLMPDPSQRDLQHFTGSVTSADVVVGCLYYITDRFSYGDLRSDVLHCKLICVDLFGKKHIYRFSIGNSSGGKPIIPRPRGVQIVLPKVGVRYRPEDDR